MTLLEMSLSAAFLIAAIWGARSLAFNYLPKTAFLVLWLVALCRLLIPFSAPSAFSIFALFERAGVSPGSGQMGESVAFAGPYTPPSAQSAGTSAAGAPFSLSPILLVWLAGAAALGIWFAAQYFRSYREFRTSLPAEHPYISTWLKQHQTIRPIQIRVSDRIAAPLTYGIVRPVILLPRETDLEDETRLGYVLAHEFVHVRRLDALSKILLTAALCLHWFNPLVWVMAFLANRDLELTCDEAVVRQFGPACAPDYAMTLIGMQERGNPSPLHSGFSRYAIEERVRAIMKPKRTTLMGIIIAIIIVAVTATAFATSAPTSEVTAANAPAASEYENYAEYEPYGLAYSADTDELYYHGQLARYFLDQYPLDETSFASHDHYDKQGVIDVYAERNLLQIKHNTDGSFDPGGKLTGLRQATQAEFDALNTARLEAPETAAAYAAEDGELSPDEWAELYAVYEPFGMTYDQAGGKLFYNGQSVRYFLDVMKGDMEEMENGSFTGVMRMGTFDENGTVDVYAVRDASHPDAEGYGKLTGLAAYTQEAFDERTKEMKEERGAPWDMNEVVKTAVPPESAALAQEAAG